MAEHSLREQLLQRIIERLRPVADFHQASLHRSPTVAISREQSPALVMFAEGDAIRERTNDRLTRDLTIRVIALARAIPPASPESEADRLLVDAHTALMADRTLGGLALGIREIESEFEIEDADAIAAAIPARYQITYRTLIHDLTQAG